MAPSCSRNVFLNANYELKVNEKFMLAITLMLILKCGIVGTSEIEEASSSGSTMIPTSIAPAIL